MISIPSALTILICEAAPLFNGAQIYLSSTLPTFTLTYSLYLSEETSLFELIASISSLSSILCVSIGLTNKSKAK